MVNEFRFGALRIDRRLDTDTKNRLLQRLERDGKRDETTPVGGEGVSVPQGTHATYWSDYPTLTQIPSVPQGTHAGSWSDYATTTQIPTVPQGTHADSWDRYPTSDVVAGWVNNQNFVKNSQLASANYATQTDITTAVNGVNLPSGTHSAAWADYVTQAQLQTGVGAVAVPSVPSGMHADSWGDYATQTQLQAQLQTQQTQITDAMPSVPSGSHADSWDMYALQSDLTTQDSSGNTVTKWEFAEANVAAEYVKKSELPSDLSTIGDEAAINQTLSAYTPLTSHNLHVYYVNTQLAKLIVTDNSLLNYGALRVPTWANMIHYLTTANAASTYALQTQLPDVPQGIPAATWSQYALASSLPNGTHAPNWSDYALASAVAQPNLDGYLTQAIAASTYAAKASVPQGSPAVNWSAYALYSDIPTLPAGMHAASWADYSTVQQTTQQIASTVQQTTQQIAGLQTQTTQQIAGLQTQTTQQIAGLQTQISSNGPALLSQVEVWMLPHDDDYGSAQQVPFGVPHAFHQTKHDQYEDYRRYFVYFGSLVTDVIKKDILNEPAPVSSFTDGDWDWDYVITISDGGNNSRVMDDDSLDPASKPILYRNKKRTGFELLVKRFGVNSADCLNKVDFTCQNAAGTFVMGTIWANTIRNSDRSTWKVPGYYRILGAHQNFRSNQGHWPIKCTRLKNDEPLQWVRDGFGPYPFGSAIYETHRDNIDEGQYVDEYGSMRVTHDAYDLYWVYLNRLNLNRHLVSGVPHVLNKLDISVTPTNYQQATNYLAGHNAVFDDWESYPNVWP